MRTSHLPDVYRCATRPGAAALLICACLMGAWPGGSGLPSPNTEGRDSVKEFVRQFEMSYRSVFSLKADFTQTYLQGGRRRVESGSVVFARGGRMRWDYREPVSKLFLSDGKKLLFYVPEEKQLTRTAVKSSEDFRLPFSLLLSRLSLSKVFSRVEFADQALESASGNRILRGFPKPDSAEDYHDVLIELTPEFDVARLVVSYIDQSRMEFTFNHVARNVLLKPSLFQFVPPADTEIIEQR